MEYLDKIILCLSCIFEIYIFHDFFYAYFDYRSNMQEKWKRVAGILLAIIALFTVNTYGNSYMNLIGAIIIVWTYFSVVFQVNIGTRILYFSIAYFVAIGCEFLFMILLSLPTYIQKSSTVANLSAIPWHMLTMKLLTYILFSIIKQFMGHSKKTIDSKIFVYYLCIPIASLGIMFLTYYSGMDTSIYLSEKILLSVSFAIMLFGNMLVFHAFNQYSEELYVTAEQKLIISRQEMDLQYYAQVQGLEDKHRKFIHDISHHLKTIGELAKENKTGNIISILQALNVELENSVFTIYSDNPVLNSVLSEKKSVADKKGVEMDIYVEPGTNMSRIADADIVTMLSNLLENALRAAADADDKSIVVRIYSENEGCFHIIKISNYFKGAVISTENGFASTKKEEGIHGIGIKSVESTAEKYDGYLECFVEDNLFTAVVILSVL